MGQIYHEDNKAYALGPLVHLETSKALGGLLAILYHIFVGIFYFIF